MSNPKYRGPQYHTPRYHCKYCDVWVGRSGSPSPKASPDRQTNDDKPSRDHHENGARHKGNVERWIRGLYKQSAEDKRSRAETEREMAAIEASAARAISKDLGITPPQRAVERTVETAKAARTNRRPASGLSSYGYGAGGLHVPPEEEEEEGQPEIVTTQEARVGAWQPVQVARPSSSAAVSPLPPIARSRGQDDSPEDYRPVTRQYDEVEDPLPILTTFKRKRRDGGKEVKTEPNVKEVKVDIDTPEAVSRQLQAEKEAKVSSIAPTEPSLNVFRKRKILP